MMSVLTCPVCQGAMREMNREGILIDVCTQCRGVWLDRGELEKLAAFMPAPMEARRPVRGAPEPYRDREDYPYRERPRGRDDGDDDDARYADGRRSRDDDDRRYRGGDDRGGPERSGIGRFLDFFD
jgi:Zn-finger nucleic acid-binding protein